MRKLLLAIAAVSVPQAVQAEERTPATAFAFVQDMVTDGSWTGEAKLCRQINNRSECRTTDDNRITSVTSADAAHCKVTFTMTMPESPSTPTRTINFTRNFTLGYGTIYSYVVWFQGPVADTNGEIVPIWSMKGPSSEVVEQVEKALQFIYQNCREMSVWQTGG